jgi:predicted ATPase
LAHWLDFASTRGEDPEPQPDLSNIASWYRRLVQEDPGQNAALTSSLHAVINDFAFLRFDPAGKSRLLMAEFVDGRGKSQRFGFEELSEGQRCLICLYAILHFELRDGATVIIDEPDNFVSLREIQPWLMEATESVEDGRGQLLLISHHPEILNQWAPEYGVRFVRDGIGPVRIEEFHGDPESILTPAEIVARGWENE